MSSCTTHLQVGDIPRGCKKGDIPHFDACVRVRACVLAVCVCVCVCVLYFILSNPMGRYVAGVRRKYHCNIPNKCSVYCSKLCVCLCVCVCVCVSANVVAVPVRSTGREGRRYIRYYLYELAIGYPYTVLA